MLLSPAGPAPQIESLDEMVEPVPPRLETPAEVGIRLVDAAFPPSYRQDLEAQARGDRPQEALAPGAAARGAGVDEHHVRLCARVQSFSAKLAVSMKTSGSPARGGGAIL